MSLQKDLDSTEIYNILVEEDDYDIVGRILNHSVFKKFKDKKITSKELMEELKIPLVVVESDFDNLSEFDKGGLLKSEGSSLENYAIIHMADDGYYERIVFNKDVIKPLISREFIILTAIVTNFIVRLIEGTRDYDTDRELVDIRLADFFYQYIALSLYFDVDDIRKFSDELYFNEFSDSDFDSLSDEKIVQYEQKFVDAMMNHLNESREMILLYTAVTNDFILSFGTE